MTGSDDGIAQLLGVRALRPRVDEQSNPDRKRGARDAADAIDNHPGLEGATYSILEEDEDHDVWRIDAYPTTEEESAQYQAVLGSFDGLVVTCEKLADAGTAGGAPEKAAPALVTVAGMTVSSMTDELRAQYAIDKDVNGAVVTQVAQDGPAADKRLEPGDVITEAGEQPVQGAADVSTRIDEAKKASKNSLLLLVAKGGKAGEMRFIALKIKE